MLIFIVGIDFEKRKAISVPIDSLLKKRGFKGQLTKKSLGFY